MGQRSSTQRHSEPLNDPPAAEVPAQPPPVTTQDDVSPGTHEGESGSSLSLRRATGSVVARILSTAKSDASSQRQVEVQSDEREGSMRLGDVVRGALSFTSSSHDQEPTAHQQLDDSLDSGRGGAARPSALSSSPLASYGSPRSLHTDDAHPLQRAIPTSSPPPAPASLRGSLARSPAPKLSRFRPSMPQPPGSPQSQQSGYASSSDSRSLDSSSSSSSDDELVSSSGELEVNDWLDEPEDAVLSPPSAPRRGRHASACSSVSSHTSHAGLHSLMHSSGGRASGTSSSHSLTAMSSWLNSPDDPEEEEDATDDEPVALTPFLKENMPVYEIMKQVQLFRNLSQMQQEQVVRALKPAKFSDGEVIVAQGTRGSRFYMIAKGEAVVTKTIASSSHSVTGSSTPSTANSTQERMVTHLRAGHYFGELALIYDDPRTATVRAVGDVELLYLTQEDFQHIGQVHLSLMLQQVPLLARLSARDQDIVLKCLRPANFSDGEFIVRQGEEGTRFYMITRGEAIVSEKAVGANKKPYEKELTRLYEGHVFGEMSLIYSEPRTASVRAVGPVKCLYLCKEDFEKCLLSDHFQRVIQEAYVEKATRRAMRLRLQQRVSSAASLAASTPQGGNSGAESSSNSIVGPPPAPTSPVKATETKKLVKQRLKNGQVVVNKYVIKGDLGRGTFGRVKLCESQEDGRLYAVKIMHKTFVQRMAGKEDQLHDVLRREVAIMKKLNHRNVVKLVEVIDDPSSQKMYLVQEYVQHNLMEEVTSNRRLTEPIARKYMRDLLCGLQYLHFHKVIHRDIKPENILVTSDGVAKIADFGTARMIMNESETISGAKGTPAFMAPEMFNIDATYMGPAVDVWSLGATLYMMVIGHPPWLADNEIVLAERVQRVELRFPKEVERTMEPHLKNLLQRMLTKDPDLRITLKECFTHEWITKEGSDPLGLVAPEKDLTVSMDESERAIENIPERIDQRLADSLAQAHLMVKTRQESTATGTGVVRTNSGRNFGLGTPVSGQLGSRIPSSASNSSVTTVTSSTSISPNRASTEEVSRIICAWRHHKRVQLMDGHKELSERSRELLLEQKRMAFSADRAKVTEIILPAAKPTSRSRYPSTASSSSLFQVKERSSLSAASSTSSLAGASGVDASTEGSSPSSPRSKSLTSGRSNSVDSNPLLSRKSNSHGRLEPKDSGSLVGFGRTSFTSVSQLSENGAFSVTNVEENSLGGARGSFSSSSDASSGGQSNANDGSFASRNNGASDVDLMKRSLSRKKDFLMVTSEVFRDEGGDYQSRKILFQAKDDDFSVASRVPTHSNSGRELLPPARSGSVMSANSGSSSAQGKKRSGHGSGNTLLTTKGSRGSQGSRSSRHSMNGSAGSIGSSSRSAVADDEAVEEFDMEGIDCVQVTDVDVDDDEETGAAGLTAHSGSSSRHFHHHASDSSRTHSHSHSQQSQGMGGGLSDDDSDSDESDYSDVEADVDVDATFSDLIGTPNTLEMVNHDDEEIAPIISSVPSLTSMVGSSSSSLDVDNSGNVLTLGSLASMASGASAMSLAALTAAPEIVQVYVSSKIRENLQLAIRSGYAEAKGSRSYMEDRTLGQTTVDLTRYPEALSGAYSSLAFFAVYDGHNGSDTAVRLQQELHHRFFAEGGGFAESPMTCISSVCEALDHEILEQQNRSVLPKRKRTMGPDELHHYYEEQGLDSSLVDGECCEIDGEVVCGEDMKAQLQPISFSGSASVFVVVAKQRKKRCHTSKDEDKTDETTEDNSKEDSEETAEDDQDSTGDEEDQPTRLYVANVGDCRAVLCTESGMAVDLTTDHKASLPEEQARIEASGGFVHNGRLDGILAISRGFGDLAHKQDGHLVVTPDVKEHLVGPADQFLLLASDGLFDVLSSQQAVNFVLRKLQTHGDVQLAAQELVLKAMAYFAHDNVSVIIVALNQHGDATA